MLNGRIWWNKDIKIHVNVCTGNVKLQFDVRVNNTSALRFTRTKPREHVAVAMTAARFDAALTEDKMASALQR